MSDILWLNCEDNPITYNKKNYLLRAAQRLGIDYVKDFKDRTDKEPCDYVLNIEPYVFHGANKWCGIWEIDLLLDRPEYDPEHWEEANDIFIAILYIQTKLIPFLKKCVPLFQAADTEIHKRIPTIKQKYNFIHAGTRGLDIYKERDRLIDLLKGNGFSFKDYGKEMRPHDYIDKLNTAQVQFIRSMGGSWEYAEAAQRFFECLAIGPVLVMDTPELPNLFLEEGVDYFVYRNDEELVSKMHYLIDHPDFALTMAENGREKVRLYHTYEHRLFTILNQIKKYGFASGI